MRILYLSQYFPPEAGATQTRAYEMGRNFVRLGNPVTMLAELPNHPSGIFPPEYRGMLYQRADLEGIDVIRVWVKASPVKTFHSRMLFYLSYMCTASIAGLFLARGHYDLVYASSPPLFVGASALFLSWMRRLPMVFEVRDLWPESAVALGEISNQRAIAWATRLELACYRRSIKVICVTEGIRERLIQRGIPAQKIELVPNGANVNLFQFSRAARQEMRSELGLADQFLAVYAGIHGVAQGLETVIEAARLLQDDPRFHFLLIGDGPKKAELSQLAAGYALRNLTLLPEQPRERIPAYLSAADAALIPLKNLQIFHGALPSKMFDAWACQRPLLLSVDGEARKVMEQAQGGLFIPPENPPALVAGLVHLRSSPQECQDMGLRGRRLTELEYSRTAQAEKLAQILTAALSARG
jgi:glycosyltransferase involved in cell wall biosynthesis